MSLAPVITISRSIVAARSLRYPEKEKKDSGQPRVLYRDGINCRAETAVEEFTHLRRKHGHTGEAALRKVPATYGLSEPGEEATHLRKLYPSGRKYWAEPRDGETPTHVRREGVAYEPAGRAVATHRRVGRRWVKDQTNPTHVDVEGGYVRGSEAINLIYSFDLSSVNPRDSADTARAFQYVRAEIEVKFRATDGGCAVQAKLVAQADAKGMVDEHGNMLTVGGKFHVHAVLNAVQAHDMEIDGETFRAGRKLSAKATDIEWIRDRHDEFARDHPEWGFTPQPKNHEERQAEKRSAMDRRMAASGSRSNHDIIRDSHEAAMDDARVGDLNSFIEIMREDFGVTVNHRGKKLTLSYRLDDMSQPVRGQRLGDHYDYANTLSQLEAKAGGLPRRRRPQASQQLPAKPDPVPTRQEVDEARRVIAELASEESLDQWIEDWADEERTTIAWLGLDKGFDASDRADRQLLHRWKTRWETELKAHRDKTIQASEPGEPRTTASGTKRPEDMTSTPAETRTPVPRYEPVATIAERTLRKHPEEEEERRTAEKQPARSARKLPPNSGLSFTDFGRRRAGTAPAVRNEATINLPAASEPSQNTKPEPGTVSTSFERSEVMKDSGPLDRASQDAGKQLHDQATAHKLPRKSARQLAADKVERRLEELKDGRPQRGEGQFE